MLTETRDAVTVHPLNAESVDEWDSYVLSHPKATFFHRSAWAGLIKQSFGHDTHFIHARRRGSIVGVLPLARIRSRLFGDALVSTPFCVSGGAVADDDSVRRELEDHACALAESLGVDYLELRDSEDHGSDWPGKALHVNFSKAIDPDPEVNMKAIPRKQRAMVRKGIKAGLVSEWEPDTKRFFQAYSESVRNLGTPVLPESWFAALKHAFADDCSVLTVSQEGNLVASVLSFYFKDQVLPYYGGGTALSRPTKGNDFMYWELMRRSAEKGVRVFDYGRSKLGSGSYSFKKNWGFEAVPLHYRYHLVKAKSVPDINPTNPKYRFFIAGWKRLPLPISRIAGPLLARSLG